MKNYFLLVISAVFITGCAANYQIKMAKSESDVINCNYLGIVNSTGRTDKKAINAAIKKLKALGGDTLLDEHGIKIGFSDGIGPNSKNPPFFNYSGKAYDCSEKEN